jgi:hypothetical protein
MYDAPRARHVPRYDRTNYVPTYLTQLYCASFLVSHSASCSAVDHQAVKQPSPAKCSSRAYLIISVVLLWQLIRQAHRQLSHFGYNGKALSSMGRVSGLEKLHSADVTHPVLFRSRLRNYRLASAHLYDLIPLLPLQLLIASNPGPDHSEWPRLLPTQLARKVTVAR